MEVCKACNRTTFVEDRAQGDIICVNCGTVQEGRVIDYEGPRKFADAEEDRSHTAATDTLNPDDPYATMLTGGNGERSRLDFRHKTISKNNRLTNEINSRIQQIGENMSIPGSTIRSAKEMFQEFLKKNNTTIGKAKYSGYAAALLRRASLRDNCPRTMKEMTAASGAKSIRQCLHQLDKVLGHVVAIQASNLLPRLCQQVGAPLQIEQLATSATEKAKEFAEGRQPATIAGACLLMVCTLVGSRPYPPKDLCASIAQFVELSPETILSACKTFLDRKDHILPTYPVNPGLIDKISTSTAITPSTPSATAKTPSPSLTPSPGAKSQDSPLLKTEILDVKPESPSISRLDTERYRPY